MRVGVPITCPQMPSTPRLQIYRSSEGTLLNPHVAGSYQAW
jgi:hypothetical protein